MLSFFGLTEIILQPVPQIRYCSYFRFEGRDELAVEVDQSTKLVVFPNTLRRMDFPDFIDKAIIGLITLPQIVKPRKEILSMLFPIDFNNGAHLVFQS